MRDIRDPAQAEALEHEAPEAYLRRREFLQRAAVLAGLGLAAAGTLSPETLIAAATRRTVLPSPRNLPIDTFVVLMMENRSFDHYLGWLPDADGIQSGLTYTDASGAPHATHRLTEDFPGCAHPDPDHSWEGGRAQVARGQMDGFLRSGAKGVSGRYFYTDIPFSALWGAPDLPRPAHIMSRACAPASSAARPKPHDVVDLLASGYLERLGFHYRPATRARTFR